MRGKVTTTTSDGYYQISNIPPLSGNDWYAVGAYKDGYEWDSRSLHTITGTLVNIDDLILHTQKWVTFDWVYQPDGTTNLATGVYTGSATLHSTVRGYPGNLPLCGFIFSNESITGPVSDVYFGDCRESPYSFWANNGGGGVHDIGEVSLDSVTNAPSASNGVGILEFYDDQDTVAIVGHTYCVVTRDGLHYAKIHVTDTGEETVQPSPTPEATTATSVPTATKSTQIPTSNNPTFAPTFQSNTLASDIVGQLGGTVETSDGHVSVTFPAGMLSDETSVTISSSSCPSSNGYLVGDSCFSIEADGFSTGLDETTICMQYSDYDLSLANGDPSLLTLGYYSGGTWHEAENVYVSGNQICCTTDHLSEWAVLAKQISQSSVPIAVYIGGTMGAITVIAILMLFRRRVAVSNETNTRIRRMKTQMNKWSNEGYDVSDLENLFK